MFLLGKILFGNPALGEGLGNWPEGERRRNLQEERKERSIRRMRIRRRTSFPSHPPQFYVGPFFPLWGWVV